MCQTESTFLPLSCLQLPTTPRISRGSAKLSRHRNTIVPLVNTIVPLVKLSDIDSFPKTLLKPDAYRKVRIAAKLHQPSKTFLALSHKLHPLGTWTFCKMPSVGEST